MTQHSKTCWGQTLARAPCMIKLPVNMYNPRAFFPLVRSLQAVSPTAPVPCASLSSLFLSFRICEAMDTFKSLFGTLCEVARERYERSCRIETFHLRIDQCYSGYVRRPTAKGTYDDRDTCLWSSGESQADVLSPSVLHVAQSTATRSQSCAVGDVFSLTSEDIVSFSPLIYQSTNHFSCLNVRTADLRGGLGHSRRWLVRS